MENQVGTGNYSMKMVNQMEILHLNLTIMTYQILLYQDLNKPMKKKSGLNSFKEIMETDKCGWGIDNIIK